MSRKALQNPASTAGLLLATKCLITEVPEKKTGPSGGYGGAAPDLGQTPRGPLSKVGFYWQLAETGFCVERTASKLGQIGPIKDPIKMLLT